MNALTTSELIDFTQLRATVARTKESAAEFYDALTQIHDRHLYRAEFKTWEAFCQAELGTKARTVHLRLEAHAIRKEIGSTATEITNRTALALKNVKPNKRKPTLERASKIAGQKPVSPSHIAQASRPPTNITNISTVYAQASPKSPTGPATPASKPAHEPPTARLPVVTNAQTAINRINAIYELDKPWFNDLPNGRPHTPRDIFNRIIHHFL